MLVVSSDSYFESAGSGTRNLLHSGVLDIVCWRRDVAEQLSGWMQEILDCAVYIPGSEPSLEVQI